MGIPGLYGKWLTKYVMQAIVNGLPPFVASLAFDLNGVFHEARKIVFGDGGDDPRLQQALANTDENLLELEVHNAVANIILRMVQAVQPRDCLILAVDGVAPGAKMQQQRGRREKAARSQSTIESFDRNAITPGTDFMIRLSNYIIRFITTYRQHLPPKVIYSSHLVPGEGEHKIMDYYRRGEASDGLAAKQGGSHVLYGLDADLIMLSLLSPLSNIFLSRETVREVVSIDRVKEYLINRGKKPTSIDDFVVMMFLIGNDFVPHIPSLEEMSESIVALIDTYATGDYILTKTNNNGRKSINWDGMKEFVKAVTSHENEFLTALSVREVQFESRFLKSALIGEIFYPDVFRSTWYQNALGTKGPKELTDALSQIVNMTISDVTPQRIETMAVDYMRMMEWIYLYYQEGTDAINQDLSYPYYHAPMLVDLQAVMQTVGVTREILGYDAYPGMLTFNALQQLIAVLPLKSRSLLPSELQPLFSYNSIIRDLFPDKFIVELDGKDKEHQGIPIVPLIDRQRVIDAVAQIYFTAERLKLWVPEKEELFIRTVDEAELLTHIQYDQQRHADFIRRQRKTQRPEYTPGRGTRGGRGARGGLVPTMEQTGRGARGEFEQTGRGARGGFEQTGRGTRGTFTQTGRGTRGGFEQTGRGARGTRGGTRGGREDTRRYSTQGTIQNPPPPKASPTKTAIPTPWEQRPNLM